MNTTFIDACYGRKTEYTPVWMMRQAGRYLPEYKAVREGIDFLDLCKTPELCVKITLQPIERLGVDAAILFSDILTLMEAMGAPLEFHEGRGPVFPQTVRCKADVDRLVVPEAATELSFVMETIRLLRGELKVPLIGFAGAPFTCSTYLIEGGSSKAFWETKKMMYTAPEIFHLLQRKITDATIDYLQEQIRAGAQAIQLFDSWAGILAPMDFAEYVLPYVQEIMAALKAPDLPRVPLIYFANNGATLLELSAQSGADVIGLDWRVDIAYAISKVGNKAVQGNLDPFALMLPEDKLRQRVTTILESAKEAKGHIFNLGHGINQFTPPSQAKLMIDTVHEFSRKR